MSVWLKKNILMITNAAEIDEMKMKLIQLKHSINKFSHVISRDHNYLNRMQDVLVL